MAEAVIKIEAEMLIEEIRKRHAIWDIRDSNHHNKTIIGNAWFSISKALDASEAECKTRWRELRDNYHRALSSVPKKT
jgi:hypothetical protein